MLYYIQTTNTITLMNLVEEKPQTRKISVCKH